MHKKIGKHRLKGNTLRWSAAVAAAAMTVLAGCGSDDDVVVSGPTAKTCAELQGMTIGAASI